MEFLVLDIQFLSCEMCLSKIETFEIRILEVGYRGGVWVAQWVEHLPSAQVMIPGSWAPCSAGSLLLSLPLPLPNAHGLSLALTLSQINKVFKK